MENDHGPEPARPGLTRRRSDKQIVKALLGAILFLFVVNVVFGTWLFTTTDRVDKANTVNAETATRADKNAKVIKLVVCVQNSAYSAALAREKKLVHSGTPKEQAAHQNSVAQLSAFLNLITPLVDCSKIKQPHFKLPPERPKR